MNQNLDIQELSIVIAARNHNPTLVTLDFLKGSGVIPADWELQRPPVFAAGSAQVIFANGVNIVVNPQAIAFSQPFETKALENVKIPAIAAKYISTLPNLEYQGVGINPKRFITFGEEDGAYKYITETILARSPWQNFGIAPMRAAINLIYTLEGRQLALNINEARVHLPDKEPIPAVLFAGNFHYNLAGELGEQRVCNLHQCLENWQVDLEIYQELVENKFLVKKPETENVLLIRDAS